MRSCSATVDVRADTSVDSSGVCSPGDASATGISSSGGPNSSALAACAFLWDPVMSCRPLVMYAVRMNITAKPSTECRGVLANIQRHIMVTKDPPKTAIIFPTSPAVMDGLSGKTTNVGVKNKLIHRKDHPAYVSHQLTARFQSPQSQIRQLTDTSMAATTCLVLWDPITNSLIHNPANNSSIHATEAGKATSKCLKKVSTPKHATKITRIPLGTRIQDRKSFPREFHSA